jgi:ElaB/YqjD/DUF883 family membrane-anchored ribosome-binding protein
MAEEGVTERVAGQALGKVILYAAIGVAAYLVIKSLGGSLAETMSNLKNKLQEWAGSAGDALRGMGQKAADTISNASIGQLTGNQVDQLAKDTYDQMVKAGATVERAQAAAQETRDYVAWTQPLDVVNVDTGTVFSYNADTAVPGANGLTIYQLRKLGFSDEVITGQFTGEGPGIQVPENVLPDIYGVATQGTGV